jgi:hypothetical protein
MDGQTNRQDDGGQYAGWCAKRKDTFNREQAGEAQRTATRRPKGTYTRKSGRKAREEGSDLSLPGRAGRGCGALYILVDVTCNGRARTRAMHGDGPEEAERIRG